MQMAVSEYRDYLDMCANLGYDLGNGFVLYPKDLREAHDRVQGRVKAKADARMRRDFKAAMEAISRRLDYEADGMKFLLTASVLKNPSVQSGGVLKRLPHNGHWFVPRTES